MATYGDMVIHSETASNDYGSFSISGGTLDEILDSVIAPLGEVPESPAAQDQIIGQNTKPTGKT